MTQSSQPEFLKLADHPALDLLNTVPMIDGALVDWLNSDADAMRWLAQAGFAVDRAQLRPSALVNALRELRELIRPATAARAAGKRFDVSGLNEFLARAQSHLALVTEKNGVLRVERRWKSATAEQALAPLAEAAAEFLATADFELVRTCENDACVLWFYDRTKSHQRRWCSMATCGNRAKVAAFRERKARQASP